MDLKTVFDTAHYLPSVISNQQSAISNQLLVNQRCLFVTANGDG